jgi:hypothetical protein
MLLICNAYGGTDEGFSAEAVLVPLTPEFMQSLDKRRHMAQDLSGAACATGFDSLLFRESLPQWLSWSEELEETLQAAEAMGWAVVDDRCFPPADSASDADQPQAVRTDCDFMQVWPERFQFTCRLRNADTTLESAMLYFNDFFTAAALRTAAANGRHAA